MNMRNNKKVISKYKYELIKSYPTLIESWAYTALFPGSYIDSTLSTLYLVLKIQLLDTRLANPYISYKRKKG
jgi:hypothetical protein